MDSMLPNINSVKIPLFGEVGLPETYPIPKIDGLLFYIQRNTNQNTVVYVINKNLDGTINENFPMEVYWIQYKHGCTKKELDIIQNKLAYGYKSKKIDNHTFEFQMVSYDKMKFYITKDENNNYQVVTQLKKVPSKISNIYVYAEEFGVFPQVKYFEIFGQGVKDKFPKYQKVFL